MNKFKNATKRIVAIAASAAIVGAPAFANLASYPSNFVNNGSFNGQVVIGAAANGADSAAAMSIIDNLKSQFSSANNQVQITYKSAAAGGESMSINKNSNVELNFGENFSSVDRTNYGSTQFPTTLADQTFTNGLDSQDYTQKITLGAGQGQFEHSLVTSLSETQASNHIYLSASKNLFNYTMKFNSGINLQSTSSQSTLNQDFQGKTLNILGTDYTITSFQVTNPGTATAAVSKIELIGGANKVSLGGGESTTVSVNGKSYDVKVINVDQTGNKALVDINGATYTLNLYDTTDIGGVSIAVTDLFGSTQTSTGYATLVIGGNKITLQPNNAQVKVNGNYVSDNSNFYVTSNIDSTGGYLNSISLSFKSKNDAILKKGDSITDPLFNAISLQYTGTNNVTYSNTTLTSNSERVGIQATTVNGNAYDNTLAVYDGNWSNGSGYTLTGLDTSVSNPDKLLVGNNIQFNVTNLNDYGYRFLVGDKDNQYIWEFSNFDKTRNQTDFTNYITKASVNSLTVTTPNALTSLDGVTGSSYNATTGMVTINGGYDSLALKNEAMLNLSGVRVATLGVNVTQQPNSYVVFSLDKSDLSFDNPTTDGNTKINVTFTDDSVNKKVDVNLASPSTDFAAYHGNAYETSANNIKQLVTPYGTMVSADARNQDYVTVSTPSAQVRGNVNLVLGGSPAQTKTVTVSAANAAAKKQALIAAGNTIVSSQAVSGTATTFDITAPVLDSAVTGDSNMIVVGGPAVNSVARSLMGITNYTIAQAGVNPGEGIIKYYQNANSVLVYGYAAADTVAAANTLNKGGLSGDSVNTTQ